MEYNSGHVEDPKAQIGSLVPVVAVALCQVRSRGSIAPSLSSFLYISLERVFVSKKVNGGGNGPGPGPEGANANAKAHDFVEGLTAYWSKTLTSLAVNDLMMRPVLQEEGKQICHRPSKEYSPFFYTHKGTRKCQRLVAHEMTIYQGISRVECCL